VYTLKGSTWSLNAKIVAADAAASNYFGHDLTFSNSHAFIGAPLRKQGPTARGEGCLSKIIYIIDIDALYFKLLSL
jgi:hypothetical protein